MIDQDPSNAAEMRSTSARTRFGETSGAGSSFEALPIALERRTVGFQKAATGGSRLKRRLIELLPLELEDAAREIASYLTPYVRLRMPLIRLRGATAVGGGPGMMLVADPRRSTEYLARQFFVDRPAREVLDSVPLIALPRALSRLGGDADLIIARVERRVARWVFDSGYIRVPAVVGARIDLPHDAGARVSVSVRSNIKTVRHNGLTWSVSRRIEDFERFYAEMYIPSAEARFGDLAFLSSRGELRRLFCRGGILWIHRRDERIAGCVFEVRGSALRLISMGTLGGSAEFRKLGALSAIYLYGAEYGRQEGLRRLDLGRTQPNLCDGALMHKRSWGAVLTVAWRNHHDLLVRWPGWNERVARFLAEVPVIFRENGQLSALTAYVADEPAAAWAAAKLARKLGLPGLHRFYVIGSSGWQRDEGWLDVLGPVQPWLADPGCPEAVLSSARCPR